MDVFLDFLADPAPVIGLSCMANLLPFTILATQALKPRYPDRTMVLGGVGAKAVEEKILPRFPWVDVICRGEGERTGPDLLARAAPRRRPGRRSPAFRSDRDGRHRPQRRTGRGSRDLDGIGSRRSRRSTSKRTPATA